MTKKYVLYPGWVTSKADNDSHFISSGKLAGLYGVSMSDCHVVRDNDKYYYSSSDLEGRERVAATLIALHPRRDGDYTLPTVVGPKPPSNQTTTASNFQGAALTLEGLQKMVDKYKSFPKPEWLLIAPDGRGWKEADPAKLMRVLLSQALPTFLSTDLKADSADPPTSTD